MLVVLSKEQKNFVSSVISKWNSLRCRRKKNAQVHLSKLKANQKKRNFFKWIGLVKALQRYCITAALNHHVNQLVELFFIFLNPFNSFKYFFFFEIALSLSLSISRAISRESFQFWDEKYKNTTNWNCHFFFYLSWFPVTPAKSQKITQISVGIDVLQSALQANELPHASTSILLLLLRWGKL